jgi:hypothetical protein
MVRLFLCQKNSIFVKSDRIIDQFETYLNDLDFDIILALPANI